MRSTRWALLSLLALGSTVPLARGGQYLEVQYPPSDKPGELQLGVNYTLWLPTTDKPIRGIIVHQHGCGTGACQGGATAAYDLHWQALAAKWNCALLGPSYQQDDKQNCRLWCDPRNGSAKTFLRALDDFAKQSKRPELATAPWCLWGHSGGGFWASLMQTMYPERIVAIWFRSGTAYTSWTKGEVPKPEIPAAAYGVPMMLNPGAKENGDKRFNGAWIGSLEMFKAYRAAGGLIAVAPDPRTSHECGDSRYLAIPFFDVCLELRLPESGAKLRSIDAKSGYLAVVLTDVAVSSDKFTGKTAEANWLPNERFARLWSEYVKTGSTSDTSPPPAPTNVKATRKPDGTVEVTWEATADFESGLMEFVVQRDGADIARHPEKPIGRFGRPLFQSMSYHDTPSKPVPEMKYIDRTAKPGPLPEYRVIAVNSVGLKSTREPSKK